MDTYFAILPTELRLDLSLYLNYRDTVLACKFLKCDTAIFWINKIRNELGYSQEFIKEYVYDLDEQTSKTLLPLNEKYLELKARTGADFGVEFYNELFPILYRLAQSKDFIFVDELLNYLLVFIDDMNLHSVWSRNLFSVLIREGARTGNTELIDRVLKLSHTKLTPHFIPEDLSKEYAIFLVNGVYEGNPKGDSELLEKYDITSDDYTDSNVISGLTTGNHLKELINRNIKKIDIESIILFSYINNATDVIDYYKLTINPLNYDVVIAFGNVHYLPSEESFTSFPDDIKKDIMTSLIRSGYLEKIKKYHNSLIYRYVYLSIFSVIHYNHLDMLSYLYSLYPIKIKDDLNIYFIVHINENIAHYNLDTIKFLVYNNLLTKMHIDSISDRQQNYYSQI